MKRPPNTGSIEQRGEHFRARLPRDESGKRPILRMPDGRTLFDSYAAAESALDALLVLMSQGRAVTPSSVSLRAYGDRFLERRAAVGSELRAKVRGIRQERSAWNAHVRTAPFAEQPIDVVTRGAIKAWLRQKLAEPAYRGGARDARKATGRALSRKTVSNALTVLRLVLGGAVEDGLLDRNPAADVRVPMAVEEHERSTYLHESELAALFALDLPDHVRAGLALALYTGLRRSSLLALEWSDVDLDAGVLVSRRQKRGRLFTQRMLPAAVEVLRWWRERAPKGKWVFTAPHAKDEPARPFQRDYDFGFPTLRVAAGITRSDPAPCLHSFRHSTAVYLLSGAWGRRWSLDEVRDHLSHASTTITERYLHWRDEAATERAAATTGGFTLNLPDRPEVVTSPPAADPVVPTWSPAPSEPDPQVGGKTEETGPLAQWQSSGLLTGRESSDSEHLAGDSRSLGGQPSLRARMVAFLSSAVAEGASTGDLEAARVAHDALARLLGAPVADGAAEVVDLASRRRGAP